ncbi:hypothetical protein MZK47_16385 [Microbacterium aerolatum]|uniref:hypothetical protein n=1 Tax=Microbacterium TaxID=33882 RepID=UPI0011156CA0|nr:MULTISPECIES: hypothetical protein [Microbacterium]MCK3771245.1 hypothetical protein [Microbacterium aerolatum]
MSMWTCVSVDAVEGAELPSLARLIALWNANADTEHQIDIDTGRARIYGIDAQIGIDRAGSAYVQYSDQVQTFGLRELAEQLTASLPGLSLTLKEEWTGEEPSVTRERWQGGRVVAKRDSNGPLIPVDALGRTPETALAAILAAVGSLGDALMMTFPGEDFWEHFTYLEGSRLAEVFEAAALPERAAMIRERCREADPEAWEEADETA